MSFTADFPERVQKTAEELFRKDLLNCAESTFKAILLESGVPCPSEILTIASAFGRGMGGAGCCCGALIGGEMAIGVLLGRKQETGPCSDECNKAARLLHDRFVEHNRVTCCRILHKGLPFGTPEQFESCAKRTANAAQIAARVILEASSACSPKNQCSSISI